MDLRIGTSGFSYAKWRGLFYPEGLSDKKMLEFYGTQLPAVEINNTFYRLPREQTLQGWASQVPQDFHFVLKASRRITHFQQLRGTEETVAYMINTATALGPRLGPFLYQLPPAMKKDTQRLRDFLATHPRNARAAFEFRHRSWFSDDVFEALEQHNAALCIAETETEKTSTPLRSTADWGYLRLRREHYTPDELQQWATWLSEQAWQQAYVFFKSEMGGPEMALSLKKLCDDSR